ncbi:hypothetical protein ACWELO_04645 [Streptomyces sp. NPDC004596]|uniref:hypothetical protein n=1 Tax=Streptomyces sp. DSM 118148 TaxID=3448667 RepID=UPI0040403C0E
MDPAAAPVDDIAAVVRRCPSGDLQYRLAEEQVEEPSRPTRIHRHRHPDGTLYVRGDLRIETAKRRQWAAATKHGRCCADAGVC